MKCLLDFGVFWSCSDLLQNLWGMRLDTVQLQSTSVFLILWLTPTSLLHCVPASLCAWSMPLLKQTTILLDKTDKDKYTKVPTGFMWLWVHSHSPMLENELLKARDFTVISPRVIFIDSRRCILDLVHSSEFQAGLWVSLQSHTSHTPHPPTFVWCFSKLGPATYITYQIWVFNLLQVLLFLVVSPDSLLPRREWGSSLGNGRGNSKSQDLASQLLFVMPSLPSIPLLTH